MNEKTMILNALEKAPKPLMAKDIVKYIYQIFDGYIISKKDVKYILWKELKNDIVFNKSNFTYSLDKRFETFNQEGDELQILDDIKKAISFIENPNDLTVQKITTILNFNLSKKYNLQDIRKVYNKHDIEIFKFYNNFNFESPGNKKNDQNVYLDDLLTPNRLNNYDHNLDGYRITVRETSNPIAPLFWVKTEGLKIDVYLNVSHNKFQKDKEEVIIHMIVAIVRTSLSFSDNSGEIFINRFKNYLELL
jgi:hypothetical protein